MRGSAPPTRTWRSSEAALKTAGCEVIGDSQKRLAARWMKLGRCVPEMRAAAGSRAGFPAYGICQVDAQALPHAADRGVQDASGVAIHQKPQQNLRVIRRRPGPSIAATHRSQVETRDHFNNKTRQMPLRKPLIHRWRHQKPGLT